MPESAVFNVQAANNQQPEYAFRYEPFVWNPSSTATPAIGQVVKLLATSVAPNGDGVYTPAYVDIVAHGALTFTFLGVVVGGSSLGTIPVVGGLTMIATAGLVQALYDNNSTTQGHLALQSAANDGMLTDSATATVGKTVGFIDQTLTISAAGTLVWTYVRGM